MTGNDIVLDIETVADVDSPALEAMASEIKAPGNYKDEKKIEAYIEQKRRDLIEKAALSPLTGRIVAIGLLQVEEGAAPEVYMDHAEGEAGIIIVANQWLEEHGVGHLVTFNGRSFDLPFLLARSIRHDLELSYKWPIGYSGRHIDVRELLGKQGSLEAWAGAIFDATPTCDGSAVQALYDAGDMDAIAEHCREDVQITAQLYGRIVRAGLADRR
jgi:uncharacterized protein YprB with RNaseH-like and TPR domain